MPSDCELRWKEFQANQPFIKHEWLFFSAGVRFLASKETEKEILSNTASWMSILSFEIRVSDSESSEAVQSEVQLLDAPLYSLQKVSFPMKSFQWTILANGGLNLHIVHSQPRAPISTSRTCLANNYLPVFSRKFGGGLS